MIVRAALLSLIGVTALLFALVTLATGDTLAAALAVVVGLVWLYLEFRRSEISGVAFFVIFVGLAVVDSLKNAPVPAVLLALSAVLAAWDLSNFRRRTAGEDESDAKAALERNHLRKLGVTTGLGFAAALIPLVAQISIPFAALCILLVIVAVALRRTVVSLLWDRAKR